MRLELATLADSDPTALCAPTQRLLANTTKGRHVLAAIKTIANRLDGPALAAPKPLKDGASRLIQRIERIIGHPVAPTDDRDG